MSSRVFGRERFFLVVLVSVLVRLGVEGWLFPSLLPKTSAAYSVGLVVVPLAANACWKTGLGRGFVQHGVPTLAVFLLLRFVLLPFTNLSLAGFEIATENVAASFLASPKPYILLLTGATLAAAANVRYGWDFNGILVPALLGLVVIEPMRLVYTVAEAALLVVVVGAIVRLTPLRRANIEGPRRLVLFFVIAYALRFAFALAFERTLPGDDIVRFMGFGYLLPTLLAVKISQKGSAPLVVLPTLKVAVAGFALGTLVGFSADAAGRSLQKPTPIVLKRIMPSAPRDPAAAALWVSTLAFDAPIEAHVDVTAIVDAVAALARGHAERANALDYEAQKLDGDAWLMRERFDTPETRRGLPAIIVRAPLPLSEALPRRIALVSDPLDDAGAAVAAVASMIDGTFDAVVIAQASATRREPHAWLETTARAVARALAAGGDVVEALVETPALHAAPAIKDTRAGKVRFAGAALRNDGQRHVWTVAAGAVERSFAIPRPTVNLSDAASLSSLGDGTRVARDHAPFETLMAVRRAVIEPMLAPDAPEAARALLPFAANAFGFTLTAPSPFTQGRSAIALVPSTPEALVFVVASVGRPLKRIVEAPAAVHGPQRDFAARFAIAVDADALVVGRAFDLTIRRDVVRAAHAAVTEGTSPSVLVLRSEEGVNGATITAWMDEAHVADEADSALVALGVTPRARAPRLWISEMGTHTLTRPTPLVGVSISPEEIARTSLDDVRMLQRRFVRELRVCDGALAHCGARIAAEAPGLVASPVDDLPAAVRGAGSEGSVVAVRALEQALRERRVAALIARTGDGTYLLSVGNTPRGRVLAAARAEGGNWSRETRTRFAECVAQPVAQGACEGAP